MAEQKHPYDDIINLPHHRSKTHPHMSISDRAAQFSPFAALTGYESVIQEVGRLTDARIELDEYSKAELDGKLQRLKEKAHLHPEISVTYFVPDERKEGGAYVTARGKIRKIDTCRELILMEDGRAVPVADLIEIEELIAGKGNDMLY